MASMRWGDPRRRRRACEGCEFRAALCVLLGGALGCSVPARPQLLVILDTDAPVAGQLFQLLDGGILASPRDGGVPLQISPDATIDTVRIDIIEGATAIDFRDIVAPDPVDWPISFGVPPSRTGAKRRARIRAFRGFFASPGMLTGPDMLKGAATLEPPAEVTIDRLVDLPEPDEGIERLSLILAEDCLGIPSSPLNGTTCIDKDRLSAAPSEGLTAVSDAVPSSVVGSWPGAAAVPCSRPASPGQVCVPGGFTILGELSFAGIADGVLLDPVPLHPVLLAPFFMDQDEFTVKRFRALNGFKGAPPTSPSVGSPYDPAYAFCTWAASGHDDLPVNCVDWASASLACTLSGGTLPTEAQWEHAARGRGQRRLYPWGDEDSTCCTASASRVGVPPSEGGPAVECGPASGIQVVGSHPLATSCGGLGDVSRDGVFDLGGSVSEAMLDNLRPFDAPCWTHVGIATDPVLCDDPTSAEHAMRGGYWNGGLSVALTPLRQGYPVGPAKDVYGNAASGFRCVYPGGS